MGNCEGLCDTEDPHTDSDNINEGIYECYESELGYSRVTSGQVLQAYKGLMTSDRLTRDEVRKVIRQLGIDDTWLDQNRSKVVVYGYCREANAVVYSRQQLMTLALLLQKRFNRCSQLFDLYHLGSDREMTKQELHDLLKVTFDLAGEVLPLYTLTRALGNRDTLKQDKQILKLRIRNARQIAETEILQGQQTITKASFLRIVRAKEILSSPSAIREYIRSKVFQPQSVMTDLGMADS